MAIALFIVEKTYVNQERICFMLEGVAEGTILPGMNYLISLNRSTAISVQINKISLTDDGKLVLHSLFDDPDEMDMIVSMQIEDEILEIV